MKALILKEARQQLAVVLVALALSTWMWFRLADVWDQLVRPLNETGLWIVTVPIACAFVLAQLQFGSDGDTRRFGLLVHRRKGVRGYFASKVIVGLSALACVIVLPAAIWTVWMSFSDPDADLIRWVRLPQSCCFCLPALLVYAIGVLGTQLRRGAVVRWGVASSGILAFFVIAWPLSAWMGPGRHWPVAWIAIDLALAAGILWLARALLLQGRDRDLPLGDRSLAAIALVGLLALLPCASFLLGCAESAALDVIVAEKPAILADPETGDLLVAVRNEDGWSRLGARAGEPGITQHWREEFSLAEGHALDLVHYSGSRAVEGVAEARAALEQWSHWRHQSDPPSRRILEPGARLAAVRADAERRPEPGKRWTVLFELDAQDGTLHVDASRVADGLPPLRTRVSRPDGRFSAEAGFLEAPSHAPLVLDRADGTLWRIRLDDEGAQADALELPGGDRVSSLEPLFQRKPAELGRFVQIYGASEGILLVGRAGKYVLLDGRVVPFGETSRPKDSVTYEEGLALARFAVSSSWPDAFTEELRVERLADHRTIFEESAGPSTRSARGRGAVRRAAVPARHCGRARGAQRGPALRNRGSALARCEGAPAARRRPARFPVRAARDLGSPAARPRLALDVALRCRALRAHRLPAPGPPRGLRCPRLRAPDAAARWADRGGAGQAARDDLAAIPSLSSGSARRVRRPFRPLRRAGILGAGGGRPRRADRTLRDPHRISNRSPIMQNVKAIPDGYSTVTPHIVVKDINRAVEFYKKAFGAEACHIFPGADGKPMHGDIKIGNAHVMLSPENPQWNARGPAALGGTPVTLALYVTNVDQSFKRAVDAGAKAAMPPTDMFWGDRFSMITDPEGHSWSISTHIKDPTPDEMQKAMQAMCK